MIQEKKTTDRIVSLWGLYLFCLCMVFCLLADMPVEAATSEDWEYEILENGMVEITSYNGKETEVVIP